MNKVLGLALVLASFTTAAAAQSTHSWEQSKLEEFEKGTAAGVSIRSNGALELAPGLRQIGTTSSTYLWSAASDAEGNLYAAGGSPARVYRITPKGEVSVIFAASELQVQALVVDHDGTIYAATSPDGRVYRIVYNPAGAATENSGPAGKAGSSQRAGKPELHLQRLFRPEDKIHLGLGNRWPGTSVRGHGRSRRNLPGGEKRQRLALFQERRGPHPRPRARWRRQPHCRLRWQRTGLSHHSRRAGLRAVWRT